MERKTRGKKNEAKAKNDGGKENERKLYDISQIEFTVTVKKSFWRAPVKKNLTCTSECKQNSNTLTELFGQHLINCQFIFINCQLTEWRCFKNI